MLLDFCDQVAAPDDDAALGAADQLVAAEQDQVGPSGDAPRHERFIDQAELGEIDERPSQIGESTGLSSSCQIDYFRGGSAPAGRDREIGRRTRSRARSARRSVGVIAIVVRFADPPSRRIA